MLLRAVSLRALRAVPPSETGQVAAFSHKGGRGLYRWSQGKDSSAFCSDCGPPRQTHLAWPPPCVSQSTSTQRASRHTEELAVPASQGS